MFRTVPDERLRAPLLPGSDASAYRQNSPTPLPEPVDIVQQARETTLDEAAAAAGHGLVAAAGREPLAVYMLEPPQAPVVVILRYEGFDLWQFRTGGAPNFEKGVIDGRVVEEVTVNGTPGYWIEGGARLSELASTGL